MPQAADASRTVDTGANGALLSSTGGTAASPTGGASLAAGSGAGAVPPSPERVDAEALRELADEGIEWCADFKRGEFTPSPTRDGWTVETHGLVESHAELAAGVAALLAVVDAARELVERERAHGRGLSSWGHYRESEALRAALEPFAPAEVDYDDQAAHLAAHERARAEAGLREGPYPPVRGVRHVPVDGRAFNERMQAEDRRRRLADLGIELVEPCTTASDGCRCVEPDDSGAAGASDALFSGAGGRPNSLTGAHDLPHISAPRPAPSSVDRVQVRRDAHRYAHEAEVTILALLVELEQVERETTVALVRERVATHEQRQRAEQAEHDYEQAKRERDAFAEVNVERESARQAAERERDAMKMLADHHLVERQNANHLREQAERERDEARDHLHSEGRLHRATEQQLADAEARLARVPVLVEALERVAAVCDVVVERIAEVGEPPPWWSGTQLDAGRMGSAARAALAEWEQA